MNTPDPARNPELITRAINRFTFMAERLRQGRSVPHNLTAYTSNGGRVLEIADIAALEHVDTAVTPPTPPEEDTAAAAFGPTAGLDDDVLLRIPRLEPPAPPRVPRALDGWLSGPTDDPRTPPTLRDTRPPDPSQNHSQSHNLTGGREAAPSRADKPHVDSAFDAWLPTWEEWAARATAVAATTEHYRDLFALRDKVANNEETLELIYAAGLLTWKTGDVLVQRHLFTTPAQIEIDARGHLVVSAREPDVVTAELDMVPPSALHDRDVIEAIRACAAPADNATEPTSDDTEPTPGFTHGDTIAEYTSRFIYRMHHAGSWSPELGRPRATEAPVVSFSPMIIVRPRSTKALADAFEAIAKKIETEREVPTGLLPMIDANYEPPVAANPEPGGMVTYGDDVYAALPLNPAQERILHAVSGGSQVLVQGPPGTGKTHTAAALISHLLAQGNRVLITAEKERALREVRDKLPADIRDLAVALLGHSTDDKAQMQQAVQRLSERHSENDPAATRQRIAELESTIANRRSERAELIKELVQARTVHTREHTLGSYTDTTAAIAKALAAQATTHSWIADHLPTRVPPCPLTEEQGTALADLLTDGDLSEGEWKKPAAELPKLPPPQWVREHLARAAQLKEAPVSDHPLAVALRGVTGDARTIVINAATEADRTRRAITSSRASWARDALSDVRRGEARIWHDRNTRISELIDACNADLAHLAGAPGITYTGERGPLRLLAQRLELKMRNGKTVPTNADGSPKHGVLNRWLKEFSALFESVRVDGVPPTTREAILLLLWRLQVDEHLEHLAAAWPNDTVIPEEDTPHEMLSWHADSHETLRRILGYAAVLQGVDKALVAAGREPLDWSQPTTLDGLPDALTAATLDAKRDENEAHLTRAQKFLTTTASSFGAPELGRLAQAFDAGDANAYERHHESLAAARATQEKREQLRELRSHLAHAAPQLDQAIARDALPAEQLETLVPAWQWHHARAELAALDTADPDALQEKVSEQDDLIRHAVSKIASLRAWGHAVSKTRLTGERRSALSMYSRQVRALGKGTGKQAPRKRAEIRNTLKQCVDAVPVWIMPLMRVAEQFEMRANLFDVIIVDEASQADLSGTFLQYLAPRVVVIGDDQQVSPSAVGVNVDQLRALAGRYIGDDPYRSEWEDPTVSLFDEAKRVFGTPITLREHRRCVPEIIEFSNQIAYEPLGISLQPVRQVGADRLPPIRTVHVPGGETTGSGSGQVNATEAATIVEQILRCIDDPAYDGKTFGVISLVGNRQAERIESMLLERLTPEQWRDRDIRCGNSADFQGSERDVMFLSMVTAHDRTVALTKKEYVQRFNVAVSRAKDQFWLFHTATLDTLPAGDDLRRRLLGYATGIEKRHRETPECQQVSDDHRTPPFDSLFEQRVYNRILARGYVVRPQVEALGYRIDLVVEGADGNLAVECDGDEWHGPEAYERDLARQRNLERCGWVFHRIRESGWYADTAGEIDRLVAAIETQCGPPAVAGEGGAETPIEPAPTVVQFETGDARPWEDADEDGDDRNRPADPIIPEDHMRTEAREVPTDYGAQVAASTASEPAGVKAEAPATAAHVPARSTVHSGAPDESISSTGAYRQITQAVSTQPRPALQQTTPHPDMSKAHSRSQYCRFEEDVEVSTLDHPQHLRELVVRVVETEGPIVKSRVFEAVRLSTGLGRLRDGRRTAVARALTSAVRLGQVIKPDVPAGCEAYYAVPGQDLTPQRTRGERSFTDIPVSEIAGELARVRPSTPNQEQRFRTVMAEFDSTRMSAAMRAHLEAADEM